MLKGQSRATGHTGMKKAPEQKTATVVHDETISSLSAHDDSGMCDQDRAVEDALGETPND
jgi:hypothetical protein